MATLSPVPEPPDDEFENLTDPDADAGAKPRRRPFAKKNTTKKTWRPPSPRPQRPIATPAPRSYARQDPAPDVDEHQHRSTEYRNDDAIDVEATVLRCLNVWIRTRKLLFEGDPDADRLELRRPLLTRERFGQQRLAQIAQAADDARQALDQLPDSDEDHHVARTRRKTLKQLRRLTHRAMEIEARLNAITSQIDIAAYRVHDELAGITGHFWLAYEQRAERDQDIVGDSRTQEAAQIHGAIDFAEELRELPVPSIAEIQGQIKTARDRLAAT